MMQRRKRNTISTNNEALLSTVHDGGNNNNNNNNIINENDKDIENDNNKNKERRQRRRNNNLNNTITMKRLRRKKQQQQQQHQKPYQQQLSIFLLIILFIGIAIILFMTSFALVYMVQRAADPHGFLRQEKFIPLDIKHYDLYQRLYEKYVNDTNTANNNHNHHHHQNEEKVENLNLDLNLSSYGVQQSSNKCDITVLFMDPRISSNKQGSPIYYSLESVAMYMPTACVLIITSKCHPSHHIDDDNHNKVFYQDRHENEIYNTIYMSSLPLFQQMIQNGQVRISFLDHTKYKLKSCDNYYNPARVYMNYNFWNNEFIHDIDSDLILVMEADSILCHPFDIEHYRKYAFVGGVWPKTTEYMKIDVCLTIPISWKTWTLPQRQWERSIQPNTEGNIGYRNSKTYPKPDELLESLDFPELCSTTDKNGIAPLGNGGFSLRSRKYMMKAIKSCPHHSFSGLDLNGRVMACRVLDPVNDDLYFATVLRGIKAPMPSAFEASLFSLEMLWPEETLDIYGGPERFIDQRSVARRVWGSSSKSIYQGVHLDNNNKHYTVPSGIHKVWKYHSRDLILSNDVLSQCPLLRFLVPPEENPINNDQGDSPDYYYQ